MLTRKQLGEGMIAFVDSAPESMIVLDRAWTYVYVNDAALRLLGVERSILGSDARQSHPEALSTRFGPTYARVMQSRVREEVEDYYPPWDVHLRARVAPFGDGIAIVLWDVTAQRQLGTRLMRDRDLYQQVLAHTTTAITVRDLDGRHLLANGAACRMIGLTEEQVLGRTTHELFGAEIAERVEPLHEEVARTGQVQQVRGVEAWEDARGVKVVAEVFPVFDGDGRLGGTGTAVTDISQTLELEAELASSRRRYREVFNSTSLGVLLIRADGNILEANTAICRMLGYSREQLLRMTGPDLAPMTAEEREREREKVLSRGELGYEDEVTMMRSDGHLLPVLVTVNVFDGPQGDGKLISVLVRDRSRVQELQERLIAAERLEAAGRLAVGVAHDANNILAAVSGYAEMLREEVADLPVAQRHLAGIDRSVARAGEMVAGLLAFTRGQHLDATRTDLAAVVRDLEDILRRLLPAEVDLVVDTSAAPSLSDPVQVRQVIVNLVVNAREALAGRGVIRVTSGMRDVTGDERLPDGTYAFLRVADDGPGMESLLAQRCFEPFFSTRLAQGGSGLGLSTAQGIARQSGGDLRVQTAPGEGASFELLLPPAEAGADQAASPEAPADAGPAVAGGEHVLVAEDDEAYRSVVVQVLQQAGYRVTAVGDGQAALAADVLPDLLLTDVEMPVVDGDALAEALRQRDPGLPVVFVSGRTVAPSLPDARFLRKPVTADAVLAAVAAALRSRRNAK